MFISKKKFNEIIEQEKNETAEKIWQNERNNRSEEQIHRRMDILERRITDLENKKNCKKKFDVCDNGITPNWRY